MAVMEKAQYEHIVDIIVSDENTDIVEIVKGGFEKYHQDNHENSDLDEDEISDYTPECFEGNIQDGEEGEFNTSDEQPILDDTEETSVDSEKQMDVYVGMELASDSLYLNNSCSSSNTSIISRDVPIEPFDINNTASNQTETYTKTLAYKKDCAGMLKTHKLFRMNRIDCDKIEILSSQIEQDRHRTVDAFSETKSCKPRNSIVILDGTEKLELLFSRPGMEGETSRRRNSMPACLINQDTSRRDSACSAYSDMVFKTDSTSALVVAGDEIEICKQTVDQESEIKRVPVDVINKSETYQKERVHHDSGIELKSNFDAFSLNDGISSSLSFGLFKGFEVIEQETIIKDKDIYINDASETGFIFEMDESHQIIGNITNESQLIGNITKESQLIGNITKESQLIGNITKENDQFEEQVEEDTVGEYDDYAGESDDEKEGSVSAGFEIELHISSSDDSDGHDDCVDKVLEELDGRDDYKSLVTTKDIDTVDESDKEIYDGNSDEASDHIEDNQPVETEENYRHYFGGRIYEGIDDAEIGESVRSERDTKHNKPQEDDYEFPVKRATIHVEETKKCNVSFDDEESYEIDDRADTSCSATDYEDDFDDYTDNDNDLDDEEVEVIMKSSEMLDKLDQEIRRSARERRAEYEKTSEIARKRSKSVDNSNTALKTFNFAKYGISVGVGHAGDLLPGIEEFLCTVLEKEALSPLAEEQRQYYLERLDIIKLPPSVPPRPNSLGVPLYPCNSSTPPGSDRNSNTCLDLEDFAAYQRELSRALETSPEPTEEVKVYDDIDPTDESLKEVIAAAQKTKDEEESMYEIPQLQRNLNDSGYEKAMDISAVSRSNSSEELLQPPVQTPAQTAGQTPAQTPGKTAIYTPGHLPGLLQGPPMPPPLPPRKERTGSDAASRSSIGSMLEERTSDLAHRSVPLNRELSVTSQQEKTGDNRSERSSDDILDDNTDEFDGMSCDSLDDTGSMSHEPDLEVLAKLGVKLPQPTKKKKKSHRRKVSQTLSSLKESTQPLRNLEDVTLTGDLHYRSKLSWNKKRVALTNGRLVCYKVDKLDGRPSCVIVLTEYNATFQKREGRRSFEIELTHDHYETHLFLADFKEWAETWCEHINCASAGRKASGPVTHLARGTMIDTMEGAYSMGKTSLKLSDSNLSVASSDGFDSEPGTVKVKKRDQSGTKTAKMGTFAFRATQFFENLGKKSTTKRTNSNPEKSRQLSGSQTSLSEQPSPLTPESGIVESPLESLELTLEMETVTPIEPQVQVARHIKHQGYLDIYSSFNKRKWGKRWCMVQENNFECYRTQTSEVCELEFLLRTCILRRAIAETKSELGLMLMDNNREKITIEPLNWTELGSWLRVLMAETCTQDTPDGLEAYMDDTNPYVEALEIKRMSDPFPPSPAGMSPTTPDRTLTNVVNGDQRKRQSTPTLRNRDSGNCSAESMFGSLDRKQPKTKVHSGYTDSSLPRVSVSETGDIYTQIRKPTTPKTKPTKSKQSSKLKSNDNQKQKLSESSKSSKTMSQNDKDSSYAEIIDHDRLLFDFDTSNHVPEFNRESSMVDEIMSQFNTQLSGGFEIDEVSHHSTYQDNSQTTNFNPQSRTSNSTQSHKRHKSNELSDLENIISPIKENTSHNTSEHSVSNRSGNFLCSSFVEEDFTTLLKENHLGNASSSNRNTSKASDDKNVGAKSHKCDKNVEVDLHQSSENKSAHSRKLEDSHQASLKSSDNDSQVDLRAKANIECVTRKGSSLVYNAQTVKETLEELRTCLVQLKKDRISIRDRKQKTTSQFDLDYLDAEFNRLNRECAKVDEEIAYLEKLQEIGGVRESVSSEVVDTEVGEELEGNGCEVSEGTEDGNLPKEDKDSEIEVLESSLDVETNIVIDHVDVDNLVNARNVVKVENDVKHVKHGQNETEIADCLKNENKESDKKNINQSVEEDTKIVESMNTIIKEKLNSDTDFEENKTNQDGKQNLENTADVEESSIVPDHEMDIADEKGVDNNQSAESVDVIVVTESNDSNAEEKCEINDKHSAVTNNAEQVNAELDKQSKENELKIDKEAESNDNAQITNANEIDLHENTLPHERNSSLENKFSELIKEVEETSENDNKLIDELADAFLNKLNIDSESNS